MVTVIIPTLHGGDPLERCLAALAVQTLREFETVVIDNSGRGVARELAHRFGVRLMENAQNAGFGAAINQGIDLGAGEFVCTLNDDAFPEPEWLDRLVEAAREDPQVGMCASQIRLADLPDRLDSAGMEVYFDGTSKQRGRLAPASAYREPEAVLFPSACAALYRRAMLECIGRFDGDFFLYCEDTDLGLRARRAGWRCVYVPGAVVYHRYSVSSGRASRVKAFYVERNRLYTVVKNFPLWTWPLVPWFSLYRYGWHLWGALTGRGLAGQSEPWWKLAIIALAANYHVLRKLPSLMAKRRRVARTAVLSGLQFWLLLRRHAVSAREVALQ
jgi:GT2 family glycosyltransferase